jgi:arabinogalactan oligomer / maltooligosaccharide transport system permease protein
MRRELASLLLALLALLAPGRAAAEQKLTVWCAYGGQEERGLRAALAAFESQRGVPIELLAIPFGAYLAKLEAAIPTGRGPDLFIDAHERLPLFIGRDLIDAWPVEAELARAFDAVQLGALSAEGQRFGLPLALKSLALYVNEGLVGERALASTADLTALAATLPPGVMPLAFEAENPYYAVALHHAFGGKLLTAQGEYGFVGVPAQRTLETLRGWTRSQLLPEAPTGDLVKRLFGSGQAATVISGPWLAAELPAELQYRIEPLPLASEAGAPLVPYLTIEGAFVARNHRQGALARELGVFLARGEGARLRAEIGAQVVAELETRASHGSSVTRALGRAAASGTPMPVHPRMRAVWEPTSRALQAVIRGRSEAKPALDLAQREFLRATRAQSEPARPAWGLLLLGFLGFAGALRARTALADSSVRVRLGRSWRAYRYLGLTLLCVLVLVVLPLFVGFVASFFSGHGKNLSYVGFGNYLDILSGSGGALFAPGSFWFVLGVTVLWTALNVVLHLALGGAIALLLNRPTLMGSRLYRVLLILPWAVPSYVTALTWKGMFHRQFGALNALLEAVGVPAIDWFSRWTTAFSANLLTNLWLGFPFMMVVTLGGLTSIPKDVYEAADIDGASSGQRFRHVTLPMLWPVLAPAVMLGTAWTFNMFNVVFLVSGGEPGGTTEILVSEAYRWAFTRSAQYGYAAAYAVLIFGVLWLGTRLSRRFA